jgi:hypothetical protein
MKAISGAYLVIEQEDGRFLDQHDLPDGNLYKMEDGTGELNNLGALGPADKSDLIYFLNTYRDSSASPSETWWRYNLDLHNYFSYQAIAQGIHHYDICYGKNYFYYRNPETGQWSVHTWDLDLTWADNMYDSGCGGVDDLYRPVFGGDGHPVKPNLQIEWKNRVREIRDLLFNDDQAGKIIDEYARLLRGTGVFTTILDADRFMWDYNPKMVDSRYSSTLSKAGHGRFYQWPPQPQVTTDFNGAVTLMKNYVTRRGGLLDSRAADTSIPARPTATYTGPTNFPLDHLSFRPSAFSGANGFAALKWRIGEISIPQAPAYSATGPKAYEIESTWESSDLVQPDEEITIPPSAVKVGHAYRVRVRMKDTTGRWSRWSEPVQFVAAEPEQSFAAVESVRLTELIRPSDGL